MNKLVLIALVTGCMNSHSGVQPLAAGDCYTCHQADYDGTPALAANDPAVPDHIGQNYPTTCAQCHNTTSWLSHPEALFAISTPPHNVACDACHVNPLTDNEGDYKGGNTKCAMCHPASEMVYDDTLANEHQTEATFSYTSPPSGFTTQNFCLSCHPDGTSKHHDDVLFAENHKNKGYTCKDCHDRTTGMDTAGANATCRRCHTNLSRDDHPSDIATLPSPSGCLAQGCHADGEHNAGSGGGN